MFVKGLQRAFAQSADHTALFRRINVAACDVRARDSVDSSLYIQESLFSLKSEYEMKKEDQKIQQAKKNLERERKAIEAIAMIQKKYGKSAVIRGMDLQDDATTRERNEEIGGHKA